MTLSRFVAIGRSEWLFHSIKELIGNGHALIAIVSDLESQEYKIGLHDFAQLAIAEGVPLLVSSSNSEIVDFLKTFDHLDVAISVNHRRILNGDVLNQFCLGVLNFHGGDLPRYRGNACQAWAIINGEKQIGACIHRMISDELDKGTILARDFLSIDDSTKISDVYSWMSEIAPKLFRNALDSLLLNPNFTHELQNESVKAHRCHERRPEDSRIDWKLTSSQIVRLVNASGPPYSGAYCMFEDKVMRIFEAETVELQEDFSAIPGQVIDVESNSVIVACGENQSVRISKVSLELGEISDASLFIKSTRRRLK